MSTLVHNTFWIWEEALSKEFCEAALNELDWTASIQGTISETNITDTTKRRSDVVWQHSMQPLGCIARMYIETANYQANWAYHVSSQEDTQVTRYKSTDEGFYDWHMDAGPPREGNQRKLSCVILLNDATEFEGGILQFKGAEDKNVLTKRGSIIVFPSFIEHKVTPVTKGVRYSAVAWVSGPAFR